jgi:hypothetical protein
MRNDLTHKYLDKDLYAVTKKKNHKDFFIAVRKTLVFSLNKTYKNRINDKTGAFYL